MSKTPSLNDDATTLVTIRRFIASLNKHPDITPTDIVVVTHLIAMKSEDHDVWPSHLTLAQMIHVDDKTIARSLARLVKIGYISVEHRKGRTSLYAINYAAVPGEEALQEKITQDARNVSFKYQQLLQKKGRRKFHKRWLGQQFLSAQRIIDKCKGDADVALRVIQFALAAKPFQQTASQSLYNILRIWKPMGTAYLAYREQQKAEAAAAMQAHQPPPTPEVTATEAAA